MKHFWEKYHVTGKVCSILMTCVLLFISLPMKDVTAGTGRGPDFEKMEDTYYTNGVVTVYMGPDYESQILTYIQDNMPVRVIGKYSNGWYRINIGVIGYVKMDSLTTAWDRSNTVNSSKQAGAALATANEIGYSFHNMVLNDQKVIKKDIFNSYIEDKTILFAAFDDQVAVSFKMVYPDKVKDNVDLNFTKFVSDNVAGDGQTIELLAPLNLKLYGQVAIFQIRIGYDQSAEIYIWDMENEEYVYQSTVYSEFSEYAYFTTTQIANMKIIHEETERSLSDKLRAKMTNIRRGIKYWDYDDKEYRSMIGSKLRKDTEYVDYYVE